MSFHPNNAQQMAINDSLLSLTEREIKYLKDSRAEAFIKKISPSFKEQPISKNNLINRAHLDKKQCSSCPFCKDCPVIEQKKSYLFKVSEKTLHHCQLITEMGTSEYQQRTRKKAGVRVSLWHFAGGKR